MLDYKIVELLQDIKGLLTSIDSKLDDLTMYGTYSLSDVCASLDAVASSIDNIDV